MKTYAVPTPTHIRLKDFYKKNLEIFRYEIVKTSMVGSGHCEKTTRGVW